MSDAPAQPAAPAANTPAVAPNQLSIQANPNDTARQLFAAFSSAAEGSGAFGGDDVADALLSAGEPSEGEAQAAPEKHSFDEAALERLVDVKANGEIKEMPLREALRLASLAEGAHQRIQQAAEERKRLTAERDELEATQASIGEVMRDPARFFSEMLMSDVDAIGYVTRMVNVAQAWLSKSESERSLMLREERYMEREERDRRAVEAQLSAAESKAIDKVLTVAEVPDYLSDYVRNKVVAVVEHYRGKQQLTVSQLAEYAKKEAAKIESSARSRMSEEQRKSLVRDEDVRAAATAKAQVDRRMVPPTQTRDEAGRFEAKERPLVVDPFNHQSIRKMVR